MLTIREMDDGNIILHLDHDFQMWAVFRVSDVKISEVSQASKVNGFFLEVKTLREEFDD